MNQLNTRDGQGRYIARLHTLQFDQLHRSVANQRAEAAGFDWRSWSFQEGDDVAQAKAKAACEKYARKWEKKLGVGVEVCLNDNLITPVTVNQALMARQAVNEAHRHDCVLWRSRQRPTIMGRKAGTCIYCSQRPD